MELEKYSFRKEGRVVAWHDDIFNHVPEYDDYMYLRGYTPTEIMYAHRKKMQKQIQERMERYQKEKEIEKEVERQLEEIIEKTLDELLKDFNK